MIKKYLFIFFFIILNNCGFTPEYSQKNFQSEIIINLESYTGNRDLNLKLNSFLNRYSKNNQTNITDNSFKEFFISYNSDFEKSIILKDASGNPTNYEIIAKIEFNIRFNDRIEIINFIENFNYKKISDDFEEKEYELTIINNFAYSIANKLLSSLNSIY